MFRLGFLLLLTAARLGSGIVSLLSSGSVVFHFGSDFVLRRRSVVHHESVIVMLIGLIAVLLSNDGIVVLCLNTLPLILLCKTLIIQFGGLDVDPFIKSPISWSAVEYWA